MRQAWVKFVYLPLDSTTILSKKKKKKSLVVGCPLLGGCRVTNTKHSAQQLG